MANEALLKAKDVAQLLGYSEEWVRRETRAKKLPHVRLGGGIRYEPELIQAYVAKRRRGADS